MSSLIGLAQTQINPYDLLYFTFPSCDLKEISIHFSLVYLQPLDT